MGSGLEYVEGVPGMPWSLICATSTLEPAHTISPPAPSPWPWLERPCTKEHIGEEERRGERGRDQIRACR